MGRLATLAAALAAMMLPAAHGALADPVKGGVIDVATDGEPPTLDPMASTADLVGIITQHIFETLYTFGKDWAITPLLMLGGSSQGAKALSASAAGSRNSNLLRSDPRAIFQMIGSSRSGDRPMT